jgi:EF-P beta-lysylation protein EpmB
MPSDRELEKVSGFDVDPVGDVPATTRPGLLQKYAGRALLVTTPACAAHCRYCFRRHFQYESAPRTFEAWRPALEHLAQDPSIHEILLSGGDPLMLSDRRLAALVRRLSSIEHVRRLRVHTRLPILIPQRVTDHLVTMLRLQRVTSIVVIHTNHPAELDKPVGEALARFVDAGIPLLNQSVLLRGVNDSLEPLVELSERLIDLRVMPYYLHQLDQVTGAAHFQVPIQRGRQLLEQMRSRLPGYAIPRFVREIPGQAGKTLLA